MKPNHLMRFPKSLFSTVLVFALLLGVQAAIAAVTAEEAAKLKTTLTPFGAERAGNADGTIPAWDGGYTKVPAGYKNGEHRADYFADEKSLFSITGKNMDQYKDKLAHGIQFLLKKHPDFRVDVYPTHRSAAAPQWVYDNTFKNATSAKLTENGLGVTGAYGGVPFPITKSGFEAMLNHRLAWKGESFQQTMKTMVVTPDGELVMATDGIQSFSHPYYYQEGSLEKYDGIYQLGQLVNTGPAYKAGEAILVNEVSDESQPRGIWQYLVGQRRVRRAPSISYDTPDFVTSGIGFADEAFLLFGPNGRHDFKLVGKKEMYIIYNGNRAAAAKFKDLLTPNFMNPDYVRWELHRVYVVEATLKEGQRHAVPKRLYYFDEDTWQIMMIDGWDANGELWRWSYNLAMLAPDVPCVTSIMSWGTYNLQVGSYYLNETANESPIQYKVMPRFEKSFFSPNQLGGGAR
ncbi:MAG: DUF1329 domain-containing protein [Pseudomonadota bacterium]